MLRLWTDRQKPRGFARGAPSIIALRLVELQRLFADRYHGGPLPDDDSGRHDATFPVHHLARTRNASARIRSWLRAWAPWMDEQEMQHVIATAILRPLKWKADTLAKALNVTSAERQRLNLRTIGAVDMPKAARQAQQRERRRLAEERRRRVRGAVSREAYLRQTRQPRDAETLLTAADAPEGPCPIYMDISMRHEPQPIGR